jgi:hypothetical protein
MKSACYSWLLFLALTFVEFFKPQFFGKGLSFITWKDKTRDPTPAGPLAEVVLNPVICTAKVCNGVEFFFLVGGGGMILRHEGNNHFPIRSGLKNWELDSSELTVKRITVHTHKYSDKNTWI